MKSKKLVVLTLALGGLCVLTVFGNIMAFSSSQSADSRAPASAVQFVKQHSIQFEHQLARYLAHKTDRKTASLGRQPSLVEQLRFEMLQGKYAFQMSGDSIASVEFIDNPGSANFPALIEDRVAFLTQYGMAFSAHSNDKIALASTQISGSKTIETYDITNSTSGQKLQAQITLDELNRLVEMKVQQ